MDDQDVHDELRWKRNQKSLKQLEDKLKRDQRREAKEQAERWSRQQNYPQRVDDVFYRP